MARTIGRHVPADRPRGDYECVCAICGRTDYRSRMTLSPSYLVVCADRCYEEGAVALSEANAAGAAEYQPFADAVYDQDAPAPPSDGAAAPPFLPPIHGNGCL